MTNIMGSAKVAFTMIMFQLVFGCLGRRRTGGCDSSQWGSAAHTQT